MARPIMDKDLFEQYAAHKLKLVMMQRQVDYKQLIEKLAAIGVHETYKSLTAKIARGKYPASFLVQCLIAMDAQGVSIDDYQEFVSLRSG